MLNLDPWTVLWTGINLVVLYLLMRHFLFKPVTAMMEQRTKAIEDGLSQAEAAKQAAQALDQENEARLAQVRGQADQIVAQAKLQGQREDDQIISSAQADAQAIRADAQAQMEAERRQMLQDAQQQVFSRVPVGEAVALQQSGQLPAALPVGQQGCDDAQSPPLLRHAPLQGHAVHAPRAEETDHQKVHAVFDDVGHRQKQQQRHGQTVQQKAHQQYDK